MHLDEIWCGCYTIGNYHKNPTFQFPTIGNANMADEQTFEVGLTLAPLGIWLYSDIR
jgi:hypothetical protein